MAIVQSELEQMCGEGWKIFGSQSRRTNEYSDEKMRQALRSVHKGIPKLLIARARAASDTLPAGCRSKSFVCQTSNRGQRRNFCHPAAAAAATAAPAIGRQ